MEKELVEDIIFYLSFTKNQLKLSPTNSHQKASNEIDSIIKKLK